MNHTNKEQPVKVSEGLEKAIRRVVVKAQYGTIGELTDALAQAIQNYVKVTGETSDGYHTFNELYEFRMLYNAALFNEWARQGKYDVHLSYRHSDGELCFGKIDYFVVAATLPSGQISNHYKGKYRELFTDVPERECAVEYDGHTPQDVVARLRAELTNQERGE